MDPIGSDNESSEHLLGYLENRIGRKFRSRRDIDQYLEKSAAPHPDGTTTSPQDRDLRITAGVGVMALMFLFYYFMDVGLQISSIRSAVLVPASASSALDHRQDRGERAKSGTDATLA